MSKSSTSGEDLPGPGGAGSSLSRDGLYLLYLFCENNWSDFGMKNFKPYLHNSVY